MPDIAMCEGAECPMKESCHRFTATPSEYKQAYFETPPVKDGKCNMYWGVTQEQIMQQLNEIVNGKHNNI